MGISIALISPLRISAHFRAIVIVLSLVGCTSSRDVSSEARFQIGYAVGSVYELKSTSAIYKVRSGEPCRLDLSDFTTESKYPPESVERLVASGSLLKVERLVHVTVTAPVQGESYVEVFVTLMGETECNGIILGNNLSKWSKVTALGGWPTMVPSPDSAHLQLR